MYALVIDNAIVRQFAELPSQHWVADSATSGHYEPLTVGNAASFGYLPIVRDDRPADTTTTTWDRQTTITATEVTFGWVERPKTQAELDATVQQANAATLTNATSVESRIASIKAFLTDPDVQIVLDQQNNQALSTANLNRALKAIVRQQRRQANAWIALARLVVGDQYHPELLNDISDTADTA